MSEKVATAEDNQPQIEKEPKNKKPNIFKKLIWFILVGLIILPASFLGLNTFLLSNETSPVHIAVVGPMTGKSKVNGQAMLKAIQLHLNYINKKGGIDGHPLKLLVFDDKGQAELAKQKALEIVQSEAIAVIGHYGSSASLAAAPIYQQHGIPAISGSATADSLTQNNDWYFRTIFNNSDQGALVANYVHKVLKYDTAHILFDQDVYGSNLANAFIQTAELIGLEIKYQWRFNSDNETGAKYAIADMLDTLDMSLNDKGILFLATHSTEAVEAIKALRQNLDREIPIIGADALASSNFVAKLNEAPKEQTQPGYYSDGIYTISPFLLGLANQSAQQFRRNFKKEYHEEPSVTSALYYDTIKVAVYSIEKLVNQGNISHSLKEQRQLLKDQLWHLSKREHALEGIMGDIYFNEDGDAIKAIPMGLYQNSKIITAIRQYQPLQNLQNIENPLDEILNNKIILINGKFMTEAHVVYVGIDFTDITELDLDRSTYGADFYLWFRFKGDFDDRNIEFINIFESKSDDLGQPILERKSSVESDVITRTYRIKTAFKIDFDLRNYPLDQQILPVFFRHKELTTNNLIYVVDYQTMGITQTDSDSVSNLTKPFFSISGWYLNEMVFFQSTQRNDSTLGVTELVGNQQRIEYSQINSILVITRHVVSFILKNLLPVLFLVGLGYFSFFINDFEQKLMLGVNLILATSLFHLKLSSDLPKIDYIILIEHFFYLVYLMAVFIIVIAILTHLSEEEDKDEEDDKVLVQRKALVQHLNLVGRIGYPFLLCGFIGKIAYQNAHLIAW
jgi:branched-chain amino acid transport system substrate-binding protein